MTKHKKLLPVKSFAFQIIELNQAGLGWAGLGWAGLAGLGMTALERIVWGLIKPIITCWPECRIIAPVVTARINTALTGASVTPVHTTNFRSGLIL